MSTRNKMDFESNTVKQLRIIAKERGVKGYWSLRRADLIAKIKSTEVSKTNEAKYDHILDAPVPDIGAPLLVPTSTVRKMADKAKSVARTFVKDVANWIESYIPVEPKRIANEKLDALITWVNAFPSKFFQKKPTIRKINTALHGTTSQYTVDGISGVDAESFLNTVKPQVIDLLVKNRQVKVRFVLTCDMERVDMKTGEVIVAQPHFSSKNVVNLDSTDVNEIYANSVDKVLESMAHFQMQGSNWRFTAVVRFDIHNIVYKPLKGSSDIPLPEKLASKKAIINLKNDDCECFKWCITRALNPSNNHPERITKDLIEQSNELNWSGIEFPVAANANIINKFERNNNISVNVFGYDKDVYPLYLSKLCSDRPIDLLLISDGEQKHYCLIKNFNRLMAVKTKNSTRSMHYCRRCLTGYERIEALVKHTEYCSQHDAQKIELPEPGTMLSFKNYNRSMRVPFVVYADFESFIKPIATCQPDPNTSFTNKYQMHVPSSFCYYIKCFDDSVYSRDPVMFTAENEDDDVAQIFLDSLIKDIKQIYNQFKFKKPMIFGKTEQKCFSEATNCHICGGELDEDRVRDHCHITGKFRGAAHNICNL